MTAKKRRSIDKCDKNVDILWSSSSSSSENEEDAFVSPQTLIKTNGVSFKRPRAGWINTSISTSASSSNPTSSSTATTNSIKDNNCEGSPVINSFNIKLSPTLSDDSNLSPVMGTKPIVRSLKRCITNLSSASEKSPSAISSIDSDHSNSSHINISQSSVVEDVHLETIQPILTQKSCESPLNIEEVHCESDNESLVSNMQCESTPALYYNNAKVKRKKYKKGGVAFLLNKAIQKQKACIGIWQHEKYLQNNKSDDDEFRTLSVERKWKEYGCDIFECSPINEESNSTKRLLLMNSSNTHNINLEVNNTFRLYPPFNKKKVKYKSHLVDCYFNISRVMVLQ